MAGVKSYEVSRREFMASVGVAGGVLASGGVQAAAEAVASPATQPASFAKTTLGKTKLKVSVVSFGAIRVSPPVGVRLMKMGIDAGMNLLHTATGYQRGKSVDAIAQLFAEHKGYRDKVVLCLKSDVAREQDLDQYLKRLRIDHADIFLPQLQAPDKGRMDTALNNMAKLKKKGKLRFGGFTCHQKMNEVCEMILEHAPTGYDACLISTSELRPPSGEAAKDKPLARFNANVQKLRKNGVGIISMKSGAGKTISRGAKRYGALVRVVVSQGVDTVLTSFGSVRDVENAVAAKLADLKVTPKDQAAWRQQWHEDAWPCLMCGDCTGACPAGLPVAALMRLAMYREHYRMEGHARQEFAEMQLDSATALNRCAGCGSCSGACPMGLASGPKVAEIVKALA